MTITHRFVAAALLLALGPANAATYHTVTTPTWVNFWPGFNQSPELGGGDDVVWDGAALTHPANAKPGQPLNPGGWTGSYHFTSPTNPPGGLIMGYFDGTTTLAGPAQLGVNTLSSIDTEYDQNVFNPYGNGWNFGEPGNPTTPVALNTGSFFLELDPGFSNSMSFHSGNLFSTDYYYRNVGDTALSFHSASSGVYLKAGQDPASVFAGNQPLIDSFLFTINVLNSNPSTQGWTMIGLEGSVFEVVDPLTGGPLAGLEGVGGIGSQAFYSLDAGAAPVPVPAGLPLLLSALAATVGLSRRRQGDVSGASA